MWNRRSAHNGIPIKHINWTVLGKLVCKILTFVLNFFLDYRKCWEKKKLAKKIGLNPAMEFLLHTNFTPNSSPRLSDRLYFFDKTPSVLMLHVDMYGTHACCPWLINVSKTSCTSATVLSYEATRFGSFCCNKKMKQNQFYKP